MSRGHIIIVLFIVFAFAAIVLFVAHRKQWISPRTFNGLVGIATIIATLATLSVFILPPAELPKESLPTNIAVPEPTPVLPNKKSIDVIGQDIRLSELKTLINRDITTYPNKSNVAFVMDSAKTKNGFSPENTLYNLLRSEKIHIIINFFKEEGFKSKGFFKEIYDGNTEILKRANALSKIDYIVLGKISYSFRKGAVDSDLVSCDINFSYKIINKNAEIVRSDNISVIGPGFSEDAALERGLEILAEKYSDRILKLVL